MLKLLVYLRHYKKESIIGPLFKMTEAVFELFIPLVMAGIIDVGIKDRDKNYIFWMCLIMTLLGLLGLACSLTAQYFAAKAAVGFGTELRSVMMNRINQFSYGQLDCTGASVLVTRMTSDINQTQTALNLALRLFLRSPFIVIGALIMAFSIHPGLAVIFIVIVPILCFVIFGIMNLGIPLYKKVQKKLEEVLRVTQETLTGIRVVRSFAKEEEEQSCFEEKSNQLMETQLFVGKVSALLNPVTYIIINISILAVLWFGGKEVALGDLTQGELIALVNYMMQILVALIFFAFLMMNFTKGLAAAERIIELLEIDATPISEEYNLPEKQDSTIVELDNISFTYSKAKRNVIQSLSLRIERGQTVGIIGGTGVGKSTLVHIIAGFYPVTEGVRKVSTDKIGIVPQKAVLFSGTIRENMQWGKEHATDEEIWRALEIAQAKEFISEKEGGLDFRVTQSGQNLSGGQRQRLTIARAFVSEPEILILDDSASALDFLTDRQLREAIRENTDGLTLFIVSQRISTIKDMDTIVVLDEGKMVGMGTHEGLRKTCSVYEEICLSQMPRSVGGDVS